MRTRRYETVDLNGVTFEYDTKGGKKPEFTKWDYKDIYSAYDRPSYIKQDIWHEWTNWIHNISWRTGDYENNDIWIVSKNAFQFTISGTVINEKTGEILGIHITKAHNYCWSITE